MTASNVQYFLGQQPSTARQKRLAAHPASGLSCHGDCPSMADCCLVPQLYHARCFEYGLAPYPTGS